MYWLYTYNIIQLDSTALHLAAQQGRVNIVRLLIEAKAQINIQRTVCTRERERGGGGGEGGGNYISILPIYMYINGTVTVLCISTHIIASELFEILSILPHRLEQLLCS